MHMREQIITKTVNAGFFDMVPPTVEAVEQERRYCEDLERQEEAFRQELERAHRRRMIRITCE